MRRITVIVPVLAVLGLTQAESPVSLQGVGPVRFGMSPAAAAAAARQRLPAGFNPREDCTYLALRVAGRRYDFMVERGRIVRVDIRDSTVVAPRGARVGMSEDSVMRLFAGALRVTQHEYLDGHYLTHIADSDTLRGLVFETNRGRVTEWRAGLFPPVAYVEGCS